MTSNEYYGMLNDRFEGRSKRLRDMGFKYQHVEGLDIAVFVRHRPGKKVPVTIAATLVMHAEERAWNDQLTDLAR